MELLETFTQSGIWIITALLMLLGLAGSAIPGLPGSTLIVVSYVWHYLAMGSESGASWIGATFFFLFWFLTLIIDYAAGILGAKLFGGTKWGMLGAFLGSIIGMILFNIPGLFIGTLTGTAVFEYIFAKQKFKNSMKSGAGSFLGAVFSMIINVAFAAAMVASFLIDELY